MGLSKTFKQAIKFPKDGFEFMSVVTRVNPLLLLGVGFGNFDVKKKKGHVEEQQQVA